MKKGKFISFEGIDACGKDTQIDKLIKKFDNEGIKYWKTEEPTDSEIGKFIREKCLSDKVKIERSALDQLFIADRIQHINSVNGLKYHLYNGKNVICGRYILSGIVYMAYNMYHSSHFSFNKVQQSIRMAINYNAVAADLLLPDIIIYLDVNPSMAIERIALRSKDIEIYESLETLREIYDIYHIAINMLKNEWFETEIICIDGERSIDEIELDVGKSINNVLTRKMLNIFK